jgi:hypothetical protein
MVFSDDELVHQNTEKIEIGEETSAGASNEIGGTPPPTEPEEKRPPRPRNPRGRKKRTVGKSKEKTGTTDETPNEEEPVFSDEEIKILKEGSLYYIASMIPFGVTALVTDDQRWMLNESQVSRMAIAWDKLMQKYMPALINKAGPELFFVTAIMSVGAEKYTEIAKDDAERERELAESTGTARPGRND